MEHSLLASKAFVLEHKIESKDCKKLRSWLQSIQGVQKVEINAKQGTITISGTIDPKTIIEMLERCGRKAKLLCENKPAKVGDGSLQIVAESKVVDQLDDPKMVENLRRLSGVKDIEKIEVTHSKTISITFNGEKNERKMEGIAMEASSKDTINGKKNNRKMKGIDMEGTSRDTMNGAYLFHGGGPCVASASCCGGHGVHNLHGHHCCCQMMNTTCPIHSRAFYGNNRSWPPPACGFVSPPEPAPSWPINYSPSAPPPPANYDQSPPPPPPPQPMGYSYSSIFSDDNATGYCVIA